MHISKKNIIITLVSVQLLIFSYNVFFTLFAGLFQASILNIIYKIFFETNLFISILYILIFLEKSYSISKTIIQIVIYMTIWLSIYGISIFYNRYFGEEVGSFIIFILVYSSIFLTLKKLYNIKINLTSLSKILSIVILLYSILLGVAYVNYNNTVESCTIEKNITKIHKCIIDLNHSSPLFNNHKLRGPNIVKIFNNNPMLRKETENLTGLKAYENNGEIQWLHKDIASNMKKFPN